MRLLLYNIRYGAGTGSRFHFPLPYTGYLKRTSDSFAGIKEFIVGLHADIIGLIEVDAGSYRTHGRCQAGLLARELGYHCFFESKYGEESMAQRVPLLAKQGNALLCRHPIEHAEIHYFGEGVKRLVLEVRTCGVSVFLVHLSLTFRKRQYQLQQLYEWVRQARPPVIVAGDFNVLWGERELELFLAATGLQNANTANRPSLASGLIKRQLDYILFGPGIVPEGFFMPQVRYSDHVPLVFDFSLARSGDGDAAV